MIYRTPEGKCPKCGSLDLNYGNRDVGDIWISWSADCPHCKWSGEEVYTITFDYYEDNTKAA